MTTIQHERMLGNNKNIPGAEDEHSRVLAAGVISSTEQGKAITQVPGPPRSSSRKQRQTHKVALRSPPRQWIISGIEDRACDTHIYSTSSVCSAYIHQEIKEEIALESAKDCLQSDVAS